MRRNILISVYKSAAVRAMVIAILLSIYYMTWLSNIKPIQIANLKILDVFFAISAKVRPMPEIAKRIILISIDDASLKEVNIRWPWPRGVIAGVLKKLSESNPAVICADLVFVGKSVDENQDLILAKTLQDSKKVFAAGYFGNDGRYVMPEELIARSLKDFGFVNKPRDFDNTVRRMRPFMISTSGNVIDYSLSLKIIADVFKKTPQEIASRLPLLKDTTAYIYFFGKEDKFTTIPVWKILKERVDFSQLKDKIVFFGVTSELFHDTYPTPLGIMSGVLINLNESLTYAAGRFFHYGGNALNFFLLFLFVFVAVAGGFRLSLVPGIVLTFAEIIIFLGLGLFLFLKNIIIDSFGVIFLVSVTSLFLYGTKYVMLVVENITLRREAITDGLTRLYLYRYFELQLRRELKNAFDSHKPLALIIYDIDHFKKINDTYGHEFGNTILKGIAKAMQEHSRKNTTIARYGGEEFCIITPGMKRDDVIKYAERIRSLVKETKFTTDKGEPVSVTMSAGIVTIEDAISDNHSDFIKAADSALYRSKNTGRDRVSVFDKKIDKLM